jgi:type II secretory pathway component PulM
MSVAARFEKLSAREQRLLMILGAVFGLMLFVGVPFYLYSSVASARERNRDIRAQLSKIDRASQLLAERREVREARDQLYSKPQVPLKTFIENAAKAQEIDVAEYNDQPDVAHKGFVEHSTQARFNKVGLRALVSALEQMEKAGMPLAVTSMHLRARTQPDEYEVTLTVSQFEKKADGSDKKPSGAAPKSKGLSL